MPLTKVSPEMTGIVQKNKNIIINGDMRVDQRLNQAVNSTVSARTYFCDRLSNTAFSGYTTNYTQSLVTEPTNQIFARYTNNTVAVNSGVATNNIEPFYYVVEGQDIAHLKDKQVTFSFDIRTSAAGTFAVAFRTTGASASYVTEITVNNANTIERKTITLTLDSTVGAWDWSTGRGVAIQIGALTNTTYSTATLDTWQAGNFITSTTVLDWSLIAGFTMDISNMQLEAGASSTPFEHRPYAEELRMCQRYYEKVLNHQYGSYGAGSSWSEYFYKFSSTKRLSPTIYIPVAPGSGSTQNVLQTISEESIGVYPISIGRASLAAGSWFDAEL